MPIDAALIPKLREATLADLKLDYVSDGSMHFDAGQLVGEENYPMIRELVLETVVSLLDEPAVKVVDGPMRYTFSDPEELRGHFESMWPRGQRSSLFVEHIFWVLKRNDESGNDADAPSTGSRRPDVP
jgi:hypothetical protein